MNRLTLLTLLYWMAPMFRLMIDFYRIEVLKRDISYFIHNLVTGVVMAVQIAVLHKYGNVSVFDAIFFSLALYWLVFDYLLNMFRNKPVFSYYGDFSREEGLSFIEKFFYQHLDWRILLILKVLLFLVAITAYGKN